MPRLPFGANEISDGFSRDILTRWVANREINILENCRSHLRKEYLFYEVFVIHSYRAAFGTLIERHA